MQLSCNKIILIIRTTRFKKAFKEKINDYNKEEWRV